MAGGGTIYVNVIPAVDRSAEQHRGRRDDVGVQLVAKALEAPIRQIAANAGIDGSVVLEKVQAPPARTATASTPTRRSTAT